MPLISNTPSEKKDACEFILFVHYRIRNALTLNSLGYKTPGTRL